MEIIIYKAGNKLELQFNGNDVRLGSESDMYFEVDNNLNAILNFENNYFEYENIKFTPSISGGVGALSYLWDFGDGTQSTELNPSHTYSTAGKYHVILIILDSEDNDFSIIGTTCATIVSTCKSRFNKLSNAFMLPIALGKLASWLIIP